VDADDGRGQYVEVTGIEALIAMPLDAPEVTRVECALAGSLLYLVEGLTGDAGRLIGEAVERDGYFDASILKEPYRLEGKRTMGLEIAEQLGWSMPDVVVSPTGGGVGLVGIDKAITELHELGSLDRGDGPRFVSVQAAGSAHKVRAFEAGAEVSEPWPNGETVAFGTNFGKALGDFLVLDAVRRSGGTAVAVEDEARMEIERRCDAKEGIFLCP